MITYCEILLVTRPGGILGGIFDNNQRICPSTAVRSCLLLSESVHQWT